MNRSSKSSTPASLPESIHRRLNAYTLAASAAGVGILALAQPAEAKIVYTRANETLGYGVISLDINNDGRPDFSFCVSLFFYTLNKPSHPYSCPSARHRARRASADNLRPVAGGSALSIFPPKAHKTVNQIWGNASGAYALPAGVVVGPKLGFTPGARDMATWATSAGFTFVGGPWQNAQHRYLGLKFTIGGQIHYGWARLDVSSLDGVRATLTGYAYETIPNKPIVSGNIAGATKGPVRTDQSSGEPSIAVLTGLAREPGTLGSLARGATQIVAWRKRSA
jgi:hypothetical protein